MPSSYVLLLTVSTWSLDSRCSSRLFSIFVYTKNQLPKTYVPGQWLFIRDNGGKVTERGPFIQPVTSYIPHSSLLSPYYVLRTSGPNKYIYIIYIYIITLINISCIILLSVSYIFNNNNIIWYIISCIIYVIITFIYNNTNERIYNILKEKNGSLLDKWIEKARLKVKRAQLAS